MPLKIAESAVAGGVNAGWLNEAVVVVKHENIASIGIATSKQKGGVDMAHRCCCRCLFRDDIAVRGMFSTVRLGGLIATSKEGNTGHSTCSAAAEE